MSDFKIYESKTEEAISVSWILQMLRDLPQETAICFRVPESIDPEGDMLLMTFKLKGWDTEHGTAMVLSPENKIPLDYIDEQIKKANEVYKLLCTNDELIEFDDHIKGEHGSN